MLNPGYFKPFQTLSFTTVTAQRSQFEMLLTSQPVKSIYCDLADVTICDSAGLAFLIDAKRLCQKYQTNLVIEHASVDMLALAKLYGIEKIFDNEEE